MLDLANKKNTYGAIGEVKISSFNDIEDKNIRYNAKVGIGKNSGKLRYSATYSNFGAEMSYRIFEPTEKLNRYRINAWFNYRQ